MKPPQWLRAGLAGAAIVPLVVAMSAAPGSAQTPTALTLVEVLTPQDRFEAAKAPTSRLAQTDPSLLGRTDSDPIPVLVKLDHDSVATYTGEVPGYEATSPAVTGEALTGDPAEQRYEAYLAEREADFVSDLAQAVPEAEVRRSLRTVYGGVAITVPANQVEKVLDLGSVVAVQADELREPLTDSSMEFIGADTLYPQLGGDAEAGKGTTIGVLDTGAWPEHPSFADLGNLDPRPGPALPCEFGDNPLTPEHDPFECQNKLVGGYNFLETYRAQVGDEQFPGTARDDNGHGTHTMSTAAGNIVEAAPVFGVDHGPVQGVAPGAWVVMYRVCGPEGCFSSDSAAAVEQAVADGVDVINYSISGGTSPFTDPVELAFLDAYAAGVFVSASAGNEGPSAGTTNHVAPWTTTVAASTQVREFATPLTLTAGDGATLELLGASITAGAGPAPVGHGRRCALRRLAVPDPGTCGHLRRCDRRLRTWSERPGGEGLQRAAGRGGRDDPLQPHPDGHGLGQPLAAGGAARRRHRVRGVHGRALGRGGQLPGGQKREGQADVMAAFSSRGPGGLGIKPDITAPGVQILAGGVPIEGDPVAGGSPGGEMFMAIGGTSMSAPHVAGAALLLRALRPEWTPGQIKSAMMTTAVQEVVKEDRTTPADPFDHGSGRLDLTVASRAGLTLDETAENMVALGGSPVSAIHLNLPSINAPVMPGKVTTSRTVTNVTNRLVSYRVEVDSPDGSRIRVSPGSFTLAPGKSRKLAVTVTATVSHGEQLFGEIRLVPVGGGSLPTQHLPVAFVPQQGDVAVTQHCDPSTINWFSSTTCTVTATNLAFTDTTVDLTTTTGLGLLATKADGAKVRNPFQVEAKGVELAAAAPPVPSLAAGGTPAGGWLPMSGFTNPIPVGDEELVNFDVPAFVYGGQTYTRIGVVSNGYAVLGGGTGQDIEFQPPGIPNPAPPNNILAPFWTDLDGSAAPGIRAVVAHRRDRHLVGDRVGAGPLGQPR